MNELKYGHFKTNKRDTSLVEKEMGSLVVLTKR